MQVTVHNNGDKLAKGVLLQLEEDGHPRPGQSLKPIPPSESIIHLFRVNFPTAGSHFLAAHLPDDALATDNNRFFAAEIPNSIPVLLIDGSETGEDGRFLSAALDPGGTS